MPVLPRVALNAQLLNLRGNYRSAGINWYIFHLLENLKAISGFDFIVFQSEPSARARFEHLQLIRSNLPTHHPIVRIFWEQFLLPAALRSCRADLLHALAFAGPRSIYIPWIVTIFDLSFMKFPQSFNAVNRIYLAYAVRDSLRRANFAIAISESTKRDLITYFGAVPQQVRVIYCGVDPAFSPTNNVEPTSGVPSDGNLQNAKPPVETHRFAEDNLRTKYSLPEKFILFLGTIEPRKNISRLIRAFAAAKREAKLPHHLILVGAVGWKHSEINRAAVDAGIVNEVRFIGYAPQDELASWYRAADLFVYPSLYEGFGLPPLEAMACGTPVLTSNTSSLPEVVGKAGIMVAPEDERGLADAIIRALTDRVLLDEMRTSSLRQAQKFTWASAAHETAGVYREVLGV